MAVQLYIKRKTVKHFMSYIISAAKFASKIYLKK